MDQHFDFCIIKQYVRVIRIDQYISDIAAIISRNQLKQRLVSLKVDGKTVKLSRKVTAGERIELSLSAPHRIEVEPEKIDLNIIYEDDNVIVINKPQGMVVHPAPGNYTGTLVHGLLYYRDAEAEADDYRPGIVHRLDKDTSGVLITAKNDSAHQFLAAQFQAKTTRKVYYALCRGRIETDSGRIEGNLARSPQNRQRFTVVESGGKPALTGYQVLRRWRNVFFAALYPETGRTHQLRVHMRHMGNPILGDPLYGAGERDGCTLMLHAFKLKIQLPGKKEQQSFSAPLDTRFAAVIRRLNRDE